MIGSTYERANVTWLVILSSHFSRDKNMIEDIGLLQPYRIYHYTLLLSIFLQFLKNKLNTKLQTFHNRCHYIICGKCTKNFLGSVRLRREYLYINLLLPNTGLYSSLLSPKKLSVSSHYSILYCSTNSRLNSCIQL